MRLNDFFNQALEYRDIDKAAQEAAEAKMDEEKAGPAYYPAKLAGRCSDGFERGRGSVVHVKDQDPESYPWGSAICGQKMGRRSAGWNSMIGRPVTCPRCLRKMNASRD
jgi:hypothetical protein